ncbi:hypothetical protein [Hymenobacter rubripertinctus]|uniref:DUF3575 domain-containing protein n=1 Tax=Hymenobacter rubripertinctus TaxID=2029981 RepID=A0A418R1H2_9BACT|nr:hypothetical protein [Hymenobacter rubripertinctus]RIY11310.1 hypothetical protein D0T11_07550 [Hymenobacter rubripertinctus]
MHQLFRPRNRAALLAGSILLLVFLLTLSAAQAQTTRLPGGRGYVLLTSGDTLRGQLVLPALGGPQAVVVTADNGAARTYPVRDIRAAGLADGSTYVLRRVVIPTAAQAPEAAGAPKMMLVQHLASGAANLYALRDQPAATGPQPAASATQFFLEFGEQATLLPLQEGNFRAVLQSVFADCSAGPAIRTARYTAPDLARTITRINGCYLAIPARNLVPAKLPALALSFSLTGGVSHGKVYYPEQSSLFRNELQAVVVPTGRLLLHLQPRTSRSVLEVGAQYVRREARGSLAYTVPSSYTNSGQPFTLNRQPDATMVQLVLGYRYSSRSRLAPYLSARALPGKVFQTTIRYDAVQPEADPADPFRQRIVVTSLANPPAASSNTFVMAGAVAVGVEPRFSTGRLRAVLEVSYESGRSQEFNRFGYLAYQGVVVLGGLRF